MSDQAPKSTIEVVLGFVKDLIETAWPAAAVMLWNYEETKVDAAKAETQDTQVKLQVEKNHESVDQKYQGSSDSDIVNAIPGVSNSPAETVASSQPSSDAKPDGSGDTKSRS